jgi:hypothetical protein
MSTGVVIVVAAIVVAAIAFLVYGLLQPLRRAEATDEVGGPRDRWTAQATLAEMRKEGTGLPADSGEKVNRSERPA